eukprot:Skav215611  [mRNA]  locus=scaffold666:537419:541250:+ [translate_table: standard]
MLIHHILHTSFPRRVTGSCDLVGEGLPFLDTSHFDTQALQELGGLRLPQQARLLVVEGIEDLAKAIHLQLAVARVFLGGSHAILSEFISDVDEILKVQCFVFVDGLTIC